MWRMARVRLALAAGVLCALVIVSTCRTVLAASSSNAATTPVRPMCDVPQFATSVLPDFIRACSYDVDGDDDGCTEDCLDALNRMPQPHMASCMAELVHRPEVFRGVGVFADGQIDRTESAGMPDFSATIRVGDGQVTLSRSFLAKTFLNSVVLCNSELLAANSALCGNVRLEVFESSTVAAMQSACTVKNALVLQPPMCSD